MNLAGRLRAVLATVLRVLWQRLQRLQRGRDPRVYRRIALRDRARPPAPAQRTAADPGRGRPGAAAAPGAAAGAAPGARALPAAQASGVPGDGMATRVRARLRDPSALREAVVLKEVLDRPLALRRPRG